MNWKQELENETGTTGDGIDFDTGWYKGVKYSIKTVQVAIDSGELIEPRHKFASATPDEGYTINKNKLGILTITWTEGGNNCGYCFEPGMTTALREHFEVPKPTAEPDLPLKGYVWVLPPLKGVGIWTPAGLKLRQKDALKIISDHLRSPIDDKHKVDKFQTKGGHVYGKPASQVTEIRPGVDSGDWFCTTQDGTDTIWRQDMVDDFGLWTSEPITSTGPFQGPPDIRPQWLPNSLKTGASPVQKGLKKATAKRRETGSRVYTSADWEELCRERPAGMVHWNRNGRHEHGPFSLSARPCHVSAIQPYPGHSIILNPSLTVEDIRARPDHAPGAWVSEAWVSEASEPIRAEKCSASFWASATNSPSASVGVTLSHPDGDIPVEVK